MAIKIVDMSEFKLKDVQVRLAGWLFGAGKVGGGGGEGRRGRVSVRMG